MLIQCPLTQEAGTKEGRQATLIANTVGTKQRTVICLPPQGATLALVGLLNGNKHESRTYKSRFLNSECKPEGNKNTQVFTAGMLAVPLVCVLLMGLMQPWLLAEPQVHAS